MLQLFKLIDVNTTSITRTNGSSYRSRGGVGQNSWCSRYNGFGVWHILGAAVKIKMIALFMLGAELGRAAERCGEKDAVLVRSINGIFADAV